LLYLNKDKDEGRQTKPTTKFDKPVDKLESEQECLDSGSKVKG